MPYRNPARKDLGCQDILEDVKNDLGCCSGRCSCPQLSTRLLLKLQNVVRFLALFLPPPMVQPHDCLPQDVTKLSKWFLFLFASNLGTVFCGFEGEGDYRYFSVAQSNWP